jgi:Fe-S cluster assembly protein SufD
VSISFKELSEDDVLEISAAFGEPEWLRDRRLEAFKAFSDLEWPGGREEEWRYTNPKRFDLTRPVTTGAGDAAVRDAGIVAALGDEPSGWVRVVDGAVVGTSISQQAEEQGVIVSGLAEAATEHAAVVQGALATVVGADNKFDALNLAAFTGGAFIYVPDNVEVTKPFAVTVQAATGGVAYAPRVLIVLGANAKADFYIDHSGDAEATVVEVIEVAVGQGSRAHVVSAQDWGQGVDHIGSHTGLVGANAEYRHLEVSLGGRTVYLRPDVRLDHPGGSAEMLGVYFTDEGQQIEHRSLIHHNASHTSSELVYKGALQGESRATFYGTIRIEEHAKATVSDETNRNLILTDKAKADSIPVLEILNSDVVRCGHHSSVGQVDELQMFYLESRGIPREEAARLLVFGFFAEVTDRIELPGVTETVLAEVEREVLEGPTALMNQRRS